MSRVASWRGVPLQAVLFDLDGTLLDTAGDIALALRRAFGARGLAGPAEADVRLMIGRGAPLLVERACVALGQTLDAEAKATLVEGFFHYYGRLQDDDECAAEPYAGAREALQALHAAGLPLAIVTNKQQRFALGLLKRLGLAPYLSLVVGGDTCERRKPDPQPLQWACAQLGADTARTLMVGDSVNDVLAARAAGTPVVCVPYGYNEGQDSRTLPCDAMVETLADLPAMLGL
ncbi:MAG TPA: phosphoglycolate phosphatase [Rubrivivax sp.]